MKGIIFNAFEGFIAKSFGQDRYEEIYEATTLQTKGPFIGPGTYPDEDLMALVGKACEILKMPAPQTIRAFGSHCFVRFENKFPQFVSPYNNPKDFLLTVESVIHIEVKKLYQNAETPSFIYHSPSQERLIIEYRSKRKLCKLMEGLIDGVAKHYKTSITQKQNKCLHDGADFCEFDLTFH